MATVDEIFASAMSTVMETFGMAGTFNTASGSAISCYFAVDNDTDDQPGGFDAQAWAQTKTLEVLLSEVGREPNRGETFTVGSFTWTVQAVQKNDGVFVTMAVT